MAKKEAKLECVEAIEYEKYCDVLFINRKRGMILLGFGQGIHKPPRIVTRIWMDARAFKEIVDGLQQYVKNYEKDFGKIE